MSVRVEKGNERIVGPYLIGEVLNVAQMVATSTKDALYDGMGVFHRPDEMAFREGFDLGKMIQLALREAGTADVVLFMRELGAVLERLAPEAADHLKGYTHEIHNEAMKKTPTGKQA